MFKWWWKNQKLGIGEEQEEFLDKLKLNKIQIEDPIKWIEDNKEFMN
jgi:hypothetical protein